MPHDHPHPVSHDHVEPRPQFNRLLNQVLAALDEAGLVSQAEVTAQIEDMEGRTPAEGARLIARCWADPTFLALARRDLATAAAQIGIEMPAHPRFVLLENTAHLHHVVVCTLCSCYPRAILGPPPVWYKSRAYRSRLVREPREVLAEFGTVLPETTQICVVDSTADYRYLVLPVRPDGTGHLPQEALAALVGRDSMIGVATIA